MALYTCVIVYGGPSLSYNLISHQAATYGCNQQATPAIALTYRHIGFTYSVFLFCMYTVVLLLQFSSTIRFTVPLAEWCECPSGDSIMIPDCVNANTC